MFVAVFIWFLYFLLAWFCLLCIFIALVSVCFSFFFQKLNESIIEIEIKAYDFYNSICWFSVYIYRLQYYDNSFIFYMLIPIKCEQRVVFDSFLQLIFLIGRLLVLSPIVTDSHRMRMITFILYKTLTCAHHAMFSIFCD